MTAMEFAVKVETHQGSVHTLRHFETREAAEDHPIRLSTWKRVWIEEVPARKKPLDTLPPFPWNVLHEGNRTYLIDATGKKFGVILGSTKRKDLVAGEMLKAFGEKPA